MKKTLDIGRWSVIILSPTHANKMRESMYRNQTEKYRTHGVRQRRVEMVPLPRTQEWESRAYRSVESQIEAQVGSVRILPKTTGLAYDWGTDPACMDLWWDLPQDTLVYA